MLIACVWLGIASTRTYTVFIVGRAFLGAWEAPIEPIVPSTIADMYFLHNRGFLVSLYGLSVLGGNELGPMLSAFIIQALGMNWAFFIVAMFVGVGLVGVIFAMPETKFTGPRPAIVPESARSSRQTTPDEKQVASGDVQVPRKSYLEELSFWSKRRPEREPGARDPAPAGASPLPDRGVELLRVRAGAELERHPGSGLFFLSPLVGSLFGTYLSGPLGDWIANWATKRRRTQASNLSSAARRSAIKESVGRAAQIDFRRPCGLISRSLLHRSRFPEEAMTGVRSRNLPNHDARSQPPSSTGAARTSLCGGR
ncbi:hypothetical protein VTO42DRAFT_7921 [Malbranchea cinnamomea]